MTVQTQSHPGIRTGSATGVRGIKGFVVGIVAFAAAATGIGFGIAMSGADEAPATVIAPVSEVNPAAEQRAAQQRLQEGTGAIQESEVEWYLPGKPGIK